LRLVGVLATLGRDPALRWPGKITIVGVLDQHGFLDIGASRALEAPMSRKWGAINAR
jgi:hypothetical protein